MPISIPLTLQKIIPTRTCMRNHTLILAPTIRKNHPVRARAAAGIHMIATENGKLLVRLRVRKRETFIVVVGVRVPAHCLALLEVGAALGDCDVDVGLIVAGATAGVDALPLGENQTLGRG